MTINDRISSGQKKILDRFRPGVQLKLDPVTGRYAFFDGGTITNVDQRPIEAMLRSGVLEKDVVGRCYLKDELDIDAARSVRKVHCGDSDGHPLACRYTQHSRSLVTWVTPSAFVQLPANSQCPDCAKRATAPNN